MKHFKKILLTGALGVLTLALAGCGGGDKKGGKGETGYIQTGHRRCKSRTPCHHHGKREEDCGKERSED